MIDKTKVDEALELINQIESVHPHVARRLRLFVDAVEIEQILDSYLIVDREERSGFSPEMMSKLMKLRSLYTFKSENDRSKFYT